MPRWFGRIGVGAFIFGVSHLAAAQTAPPTAPPVGTARSSQPSAAAPTSAPVPDVIDSLAQSWSGGNSAPVCRLDGQDLAGAPATACNWLATGNASPAPGVDSVFTSRIPRDGAMLSYFRTVASAGELTRLSDSLGVALKARGLVARNCRGGESPEGRSEGRVWSNEKLLVFLSTITSRSKQYKVMIMAVDNPSEFPQVACPPPEMGGRH